ncbi:MAG: CaiB/BaiF CoA transferase family protein [Candidatus Geothermarchaeales archaeon]
MSVLRGIRVLDLTSQVSGPICSMLLGDMGADVIKIEKPRTGDRTRNYPILGPALFAPYNRNKRSVTLNLSSHEGREILLRMVKSSHVFLENFRPGVTEKLKIDYENVKKVNPKIIYCSVTGFGHTGPYRDRPAWDQVLQAMSGLMSVTGEPGGRPLRVGTSIVDIITGIYASYAVAIALIAAIRDGIGQKIDVSLLDAAVSTVSYWIAHYSYTGKIPEKLGSGHPIFAPYEVFKVRDGYVFIGVTDNKFWSGFCDILGVGDLAADDRFMTNERRVENKEELMSLLREVIAGWDGDDLLEKLVGAGIPCAPVNTIDRVMNDPHLLKRGAIVEVQYPPDRRVKVSGIPVKFSKTPGSIRSDPPSLGQDTEDVLKEFGYSGKDLSQLRARGVI